jgi:hypothetical protein
VQVISWKQRVPAGGQDSFKSVLVGARFGFILAWAVALGVVGIVVYAEMARRVASVSGRTVFDLVR